MKVPSSFWIKRKPRFVAVWYFVRLTLIETSFRVQAFGNELHGPAFQIRPRIK